MKTLKNKLWATILLVLGYITLLISNDATAMIFLMIIAVPLLFAKENWINWN